MDFVHSFIAFVQTSKAVHTGLIGVLVAARIDYAAFKSWKSIHDAATYDWGTAAWRWFQGFIGGVVGGGIFAGLEG